MDEIRIRVRTEVNLTEDLENVKRAVENVFSLVEFEVRPSEKGSLLIAKTKGIEGLSKLYNLLRRERIRDAARRVLFKGLRKNSVTFYLNKQVAFAGHLSFCQPVAESPLGPVEVQITCDNPRELVEWLAPRTT